MSFFLCCVVPTPDMIGADGYFSTGFHLTGNKPTDKRSSRKTFEAM